ncbi:hypothetical protein KQI85_11530 [Falcatimonas sp. MSJ-15]|uniref:type II CAAX prenyl endopeptidase Rce1 family protein n=1 Tax=Falcatimonas sp. MSJ-15 TaxID=2841515 RepID=UPI001C10575A|nr:CPBP family glutamic-type intramembrane protease [Falcatimonas sp. MSJ-15]MBU5470992.1 hypothetical protein [Falcatimonas sp. MSJ-15]
MVIISIIPTIIIGICFHAHPFHFISIFNWKLWSVAIATVIVTSLIIKLKHESHENVPLAPLCVEAACMEIPQRVMMQTLVLGILAMQKLNTLWSVFITALIWCAGILVQALVTKQKNFQYLFLEVSASFVFSMGIGYVFYSSECLFIPMLAHAAERFVTRTCLREVEE